MRISVSDLQCYQRYRDNEDVTLEDCLAQLRRQSLPTPAMMAGSALHKALETITPEFEGITLEQDSYLFYFEGSIELSVPAIRELKGEVEIPTKYGTVTLVGVVDVIGNEIGDYKLSGRFDAERLAESYQWRCYLSMFQSYKFIYKVFVATEDTKNLGRWVIREYHELPVYRYPGMDSDVHKEVEECAGFFARYMGERRAA